MIFDAIFLFCLFLSVAWLVVRSELFSNGSQVLFLYRNFEFFVFVWLGWKEEKTFSWETHIEKNSSCCSIFVLFRAFVCCFGKEKLGWKALLVQDLIIGVGTEWSKQSKGGGKKNAELAESFGMIRAPTRRRRGQCGFDIVWIWIMEPSSCARLLCYLNFSFFRVFPISREFKGDTTGLNRQLKGVAGNLYTDRDFGRNEI